MNAPAGQRPRAAAGDVEGERFRAEHADLNVRRKLLVVALAIAPEPHAPFRTAHLAVGGPGQHGWTAMTRASPPGSATITSRWSSSRSTSRQRSAERRSPRTSAGAARSAARPTTASR